MRGEWCGREVQEGKDICMLIAESLVVQQKLTQHCKAIILQLKNTFWQKNYSLYIFLKLSRHPDKKKKICENSIRESGLT